MRATRIRRGFSRRSIVRRMLRRSAFAAAGLLLLNPVARAQKAPEESLKRFEVAEGVECSVFASEPMLSNPTDFDIDAYGRVWVTEGVNYRGHRDLRPEGDRIVVMEDTDGDGRADRSTVFYQGREIDSALGICVLGEKVIVSCSPNVLVFTDADGDLRADGPPEVLFTGIGGEQHDHGVHAFVFGPDGKLYFNMGDAGGRILRPDKSPVVDMAGNVVAQTARRSPEDGRSGPYRKGMVFRCNLDGSDFETLGWNFRNNYEVCVDSFGTMWQSDNDDDGNQGVRINYVMEFGNYGYTDEFTGAGWSAKRTDMEVTADGKLDKPRAHWHQNSPGIVPNLLATGGGSPAGICIYEGSLLPEVFRNQIMHCDAGPNVVRAYPVLNDGAGYGATIANLVKGGDKWFRPADVCVAPDGSVFVADWYDPGVGGHAMGDNKRGETRGRIFRLAPAGARYAVPKHGFSTAAGAVEALKSPNMAARYLAWRALNQMGAGAEPELVRLWNDANPRLRARAVQLLARIPGREMKYVSAAVEDANPDLRIVGIRMARALEIDLIPIVKSLAKDPSTQVRRECAIALRHQKSPEAAGLWAELALQHDGQDRWYLEALGLAADRNEDTYFAAWRSRVGDKWNTAGGRDIIWRSRSIETAGLLAEIIAGANTSSAERARCFRAFDLLAGPDDSPLAGAKQEALVGLALGHPDEAAIAVEAISRLKGDRLAEVKRVVERILDSAKGTAAYVELIEQLNVRDRDADLLAIAVAHPTDQVGVNAARVLMQNGNRALIEGALSGPEAERFITALGSTADGRIIRTLASMFTEVERDLSTCRAIVQALARSRNGCGELLEMIRSRKLGDALLALAAKELQSSSDAQVRREVSALLPLPPTKDGTPLPALAELVAMPGDAGRGKAVFAANCAQCHQVGEEGIRFGPALTEIGSKLARDAIIASILYPSAGIAHGYQAHIIRIGDDEVVGIIESETESELVLRIAGGIVNRYRKSEIVSRREQKESIMPEDLQRGMTVQELVDLVEYLTTLRT